MMKKRNVVFLLLTSAALMLQLGCAGSVSLTSVWTNPEYTGPPAKKILVVGLAQKLQIRRVFEHQLRFEFASRGVDAEASIDGMPDDAKLDKQAFAEYFGDRNINAVLVTGLVSADTTKEYTPGASYVAPAVHTTWYGYYDGVYAVHHEPGYWTQNTQFVLESSLYDVASEKLVWRGMSKAVNPEDVMEIIEDLSKTLVNRLGQDGLVTLKEEE